MACAPPFFRQMRKTGHGGQNDPPPPPPGWRLMVTIFLGCPCAQITIPPPKGFSDAMRDLEQKCTFFLLALSSSTLMHQFMEYQTNAYIPENFVLSLMGNHVLQTWIMKLLFWHWVRFEILIIFVIGTRLPFDIIFTFGFFRPPIYFRKTSDVVCPIFYFVFRSPVAGQNWLIALPRALGSKIPSTWAGKIPLCLRLDLY